MGAKQPQSHTEPHLHVPAFQQNSMHETRNYGYDLTIGISEEGVQREAAELVLPRYRHALVVFGGAKDHQG
eukprot:839088-Pelagomonas_calceolata.AAC.7